MERKKYNKHFFEPEDALENYPYKIDISIQEKYEKINKFFNSIYPEKILEKAKKDAKKEQEDRNLDKNNFIYGETTFRTISYLLEYLTNTLKIDSNGFFYDLGSGTGRGIISAVLSKYFFKYIGIEFLDSLYESSIEILNNFNKEFINYYKENKNILPNFINDKPNIQFIHGDFLNENLSNASFIFMNSSCFKDDLLLKLSKKFNNECKSGCVIVNTTVIIPNLNNNNWEELPYFKRYMSWGVATLNIYVRK